MNYPLPGTDKPTILFTLHYCGEAYPVQTYQNEHPSLMSLICDILGPPGFGLCCGMGSCGTCVVQISNPGSAIKRPVLACGVPVNDELANVNVIVPDRVY